MHIGSKQKLICNYQSLTPKILLEENHPYQTDLYHLNIGNYSQGPGDLKQAMDHYEKALALRPDDPTPLFNKSQAYLPLEMPLTAKETLRKILELNPDS